MKILVTRLPKNERKKLEKELQIARENLSIASNSYEYYKQAAETAKFRVDISKKVLDNLLSKYEFTS